MPFFSRMKSILHHPILSQPGVSLGLTALSLLLLVLVLLSVPGPIKGFYWFRVDGQESGMGPMTAGVLGWCETNTSNCTYAPLSENPYLSTLIDTGMALTVRIMLPLACYWSIITLVAWVTLAITSPLGYKIKDLDSITRHLRFAVVEACVLCITLFGNVLCWVAFGFGREAYLTVKYGGGEPKSGRAMETTAVAALMSLLSLFTAVWGLHLRLTAAQSHWKEEAVMVRRRSMAFSQAAAEGRPISTLGVNVEKGGSSRWSDAPHYVNNGGVVGQTGYRGSMIKDPQYEDEERLDAELMAARRNSRDQEIFARRNSNTLYPPNDGYNHGRASPA